jgi:LytR cell envelope-related transcriptional attenuator
VVLNGTATEGLAGEYGDKVESKGFQLGNVTNTESAQELSAVMFKPNNGRAAQKVAKSLNIPRVQPMTEEVARLGEGAPVAVVVGEDSASAAG